MNIVDQKLLTDLEIYEKIIPILDKTITLYGKTKFKEFFQIFYNDKNHLLRRKNIIESIVNTPNIKKIIVSNLKKINKLEDNINWFFSKNNDTYDDLCFKIDYLTIDNMLTCRNFLKIYNPGILVIIYLMIYLILRYNGININIKDYIFSIYASYKLFISGLLSFIINDKNMISFLTNILASTYTLYQLYTIYNSIENSIIHYKKCSEFNNKFNNIRKFIDLVKLIFKKDCFFIYEKNLLKEKINKIDKIFSKKLLTNIGYKIMLKKNSNVYESDFNSILQYIGVIDSFISISSLLNDGYTFPYFDYSEKPSIDANFIWHPCIKPEFRIKNNCKISNNIIITGPNTSGKSTYIRSVMLAIFLAQTIGVTCCDKLTFTPFTVLYTHIEIPNIVRDKASLFETEILRCIEYCKLVESLPKNSFIFAVMDELFTSTNPLEGIAGSYGICEYLGQFTNNLFIITTHFQELTKLESIYPDKFKNMKFIVDIQNNILVSNYKITDGISTQNIAINLLNQKGYNNSIIEKANLKLKDLLKL